MIITIHHPILLTIPPPSPSSSFLSFLLLLPFSISFLLPSSFSLFFSFSLPFPLPSLFPSCLTHSLPPPIWLLVTTSRPNRIAIWSQPNHSLWSRPDLRKNESGGVWRKKEERRKNRERDEWGGKRWAKGRERKMEKEGMAAVMGRGGGGYLNWIFFLFFFYIIP